MGPTLGGTGALGSKSLDSPEFGASGADPLAGRASWTTPKSGHPKSLGS